MSLYNKDGIKSLEVTAEERLKVLLRNAMDILIEHYSDRAHSHTDYMEMLYGELGTDETELKELDIDLSDI